GAQHPRGRRGVRHASRLRCSAGCSPLWRHPRRGHRMLQIDADVVRWREGEPDGELLVVMHGIGSHEGDLFGLAPHLPAELTIASLRGPIPYGGGFAWFEFSPVDSDDH